MSKANNQSVSEKMAKLDELVAWFGGDAFVLEEAMAKFKAAEALAKEIEADLNQYKNDINIIARRFDETE